MSKRLVNILLAVVVIVSVLCSVTFPVYAKDNTVKPALNVTETENKVDGSMIARFETMLNNNFLYNDGFNDDKAIIENSILSLASHIENGEIDKNLTLNFIANMYGRQVDPAAASYDFLPVGEDKFAVIPRGYSVYTHTVTDVDETEAGFVVYSDMVIDAHDSVCEKVTVRSIFVPNEGSIFGFNLVKSEYNLSDTTI